MEQEIVIHYKCIFREFLYANGQSSTMHLESLMDYLIKLQALLICIVLSGNWRTFKLNGEGGNGVCVLYMYVHVCVFYVYIVSFYKCKHTDWKSANFQKIYEPSTFI